MRPKTPYLVLSDIGSTTTKAILLDNRGKVPKLICLSHAATTVEAPIEDVRFGIFRAVRMLEAEAGMELLLAGAIEPELAFSPEVSYLTTSSAGGGLQILVIGLTLFDSASSAKRAAYGAGGVILDTFAVDDKRQAMEQMLAMRNLHPDMILLCGGTDGGAISGVLRLAEIVRIAAPEPKFDTAGKIPVIYAGNTDAAPLIKKLISNDFDLHIMPNLRPGMEVENLEPTQDMIQQLFMENVMEHAPGYANLLPLVGTAIIPTPAGVQRALELAAGAEERNIFAFDIGGATTDVFSYINTHFHRTVSANLGMSYSALNVLKECGVEKLTRWLPKDISEETLRNYIANKTLDPTSNPTTVNEYRIEHALAREALSMALFQHRQMHYNTAKIGFMDKLKNADYDKYEMIFEYMREEEKYYFAPSDIAVLIGAGGIFAHAQNSAQCALILIDAIKPRGITEIWIDR
ncbi:MAG: glutamate mutase L, partial [Candidatus Cloacimonadaceae bacterium]|nr:glutamate mutase L [Candidatus Cloacimonadaceae bacterium]